MPRVHARPSLVRLPALLVSLVVAACSGGDDADPQQAGAPVDTAGAGGVAGVAGVAGKAGSAGVSGAASGKGGAGGTGGAGAAGKPSGGAGGGDKGGGAGSGNGGSSNGGSGNAGSGNGGSAGSGKGGAGSGNGGSGNGASGNAGAAGKAGAGGTAGQGTGGAGGSSNAAFQVIGYFPDWAGDVAAIQYDKVTQVNYAFALPTASGGLTGPDDVAKLDKLVALAHAKGVKVAIAIGGWNDGNDSGFEQLSANAGARSAFVSKVKSFVTAHDLDGVDIDWEYPDPGASSQHYAALMKELSTELHGMGKLLSTAVVGEGGTGEGIPKEVFGYIDALNIMAYDGSTSEGHSPYAYASSCLSYWLGRGVPKQKAILGVPFYGRDPYVSYADLVKKDPSAPTKDQVGNVHYNGIDTMKKKTALAAKSGGGIMIWELSQDTTGATSLLSAIHAAAPLGAVDRGAADRARRGARTARSPWWSSPIWYPPA